MSRLKPPLLLLQACLAALAFVGFGGPALAVVGFCGPALACFGLLGTLGRINSIFLKKKKKKTYLGLETCHVSSPPPAAALLCEFSWAFAGIRWLSLAIMGLRWPTLAVVSVCGLR